MVRSAVLSWARELVDRPAFPAHPVEQVELPTVGHRSSMQLRLIELQIRGIDGSRLALHRGESDARPARARALKRRARAIDH